MKTQIRLVLLLALFVTTSCSKEGDKSTAGAAVNLQQEWFPFAGFAGEVSASKRFAGQHNIDLRITPGSEQVDPIKLVLAGSAQFGVVSGDLLAAAIAKGAPLVAIGVINEQSPTVFLVRQDSVIRTPSDFVGKKVGILPGTNTERIYELLMKRQGVDRSQVTEIPIPFDLQTFVLGQYDVRPAFIYDEPVSLEQKNFSVRVITPKNYGVDFIGTVYFTTKDMVKAHRTTVVSVLQSLVQGWQFALSQPAESVADLIESYPTLDQSREKRALVLGTPYFQGAKGRPLHCDSETWTKMIQGLEELHVVPGGSIKVADVWDPTLLEEAYRNEKQ
jgi:ABC-type nitrate/sulfonate/bicarbonate transport system substrate-binding protein